MALGGRPAEGVDPTKEVSTGRRANVRDTAPRQPRFRWFRLRFWFSTNEAVERVRAGGTNYNVHYRPLERARVAFGDIEYQPNPDPCPFPLDPVPSRAVCSFTFALRGMVALPSRCLWCSWWCQVVNCLGSQLNLGKLWQIFWNTLHHRTNYRLEGKGISFILSQLC